MEVKLKHLLEVLRVTLRSLYSTGGQNIVEGKVSFIIKDASGAAYCQDCGDDINIYMPSENEFVATKGFGFDLPMHRSQIVDKANNILLDGSLIVDAELQILNKSSAYPTEL